MPLIIHNIVSVCDHCSTQPQSHRGCRRVALWKIARARVAQMRMSLKRTVAIIDHGCKPSASVVTQLLADPLLSGTSRLADIRLQCTLFRSSVEDEEGTKRECVTGGAKEMDVSNRKISEKYSSRRLPIWTTTTTFGIFFFSFREIIDPMSPIPIWSQQSIKNYLISTSHQTFSEKPTSERSVNTMIRLCLQVSRGHSQVRSSRTPTQQRLVRPAGQLS